MSFFSVEGATPLGLGLMSPAGSIIEAELAARIVGYKRQVAGRYRAIAPAEIAVGLPKAPTWVSPKIDGQFWCLVIRDGVAALVSPRGKVISGAIPLLAEIEKRVVARGRGPGIGAGGGVARRPGARPRGCDGGNPHGGG
ncbi:MAG: hypothetical protein AAF725_18435, partial [Acidobacteriota bacterium]